MRLVNQYFWPDVAATAQLLSDLAEDAAARGWDVHVLTGTAPYAPGFRSPPAPSGPSSRVHVQRVRTRAQGRGLAQAARSYAGFLVKALWCALRWRRGDVVVTLSTPPFVALVGWLAQRRGARFVYKVEDLYPEVAVALGAVRNRTVVRVLGWLTRRLLAAADAVVVLDERMRSAVAARRGTAAGIHVIPNWADEDALRPQPSSTSAVRRSLAVPPETIVVGYAGNFGRAHGFDALLAAIAESARRALPLHFLFSGAGAHERELRAAAARLSNVTVRGHVARAALADLLAAPDVHLVLLRPEVEGLLFPSKVAAAFAMARPVLAVADPGGSLANEVREAGAGWVVPHDAAAVTRAFETVVAERGELPAYGARARARFEARYTRRAGTGAWLDLLARVAGAAPGGP